MRQAVQEIGDAAGESRSRELVLVAEDGLELAATLREPAGEAARALILISPATGVRRRYYGDFARFLCERGYAVLTLDLRGIGDSRPPSLRGFEATMSDWGRLDLTAALRWVAEERPHLPIGLLGHSAGGQIVGLSPEAQRIQAMAAVGAQSGYWRLWPAPRRYTLPPLWFVFVPLVTRLLGYFPGKALRLFTDLPQGVALQWARWCRSPEYLVDDSGEPLDDHFPDVRGPLLALSFSDDVYAPERAVDDLTARFSNADVRRIHMAPGDVGLSSIGHFGVFRAGAATPLWRLLADWFDDHLAGSSRR